MTFKSAYLAKRNDSQPAETWLNQTNHKTRTKCR